MGKQSASAGGKFFLREAAKIERMGKFERLAWSLFVVVKYSDRDGQTIEMWRGLPDAGQSTLISEIEPRDGVIYRDLRDALAGG
jgi:predicted mannosyl-3-phosphoglycerate phosphatase (HAD superfamily)